MSQNITIGNINSKGNNVSINQSSSGSGLEKKLGLKQQNGEFIIECNGELNLMIRGGSIRQWSDEESCGITLPSNSNVRVVSAQEVIMLRGDGSGTLYLPLGMRYDGTSLPGFKPQYYK